jgi:predicted membrane channel-forming protein YqfA (hemolysin III family)
VMDETTKNLSYRMGFYRLILYYASFSIIGLILAIWISLGWYFLFVLMKRVIYLLPFLYLPIMRMLVSEKYSIAEEKRRREKKRWRTTVYVINTVLIIIATIISFWKINVPVIDLLNSLN